jgi:hypothetical protein
LAAGQRGAGCDKKPLWPVMDSELSQAGHHQQKQQQQPGTPGPAQLAPTGTHQSLPSAGLAQGKIIALYSRMEEKKIPPKTGRAGARHFAANMPVGDHIRVSF